MIRSWALSWAALLPSALVPSAVWAAPPVVAVFAIEDDNQTVEPEVGSQLSAYLCGKMAERGHYQVVPPTALQSRLREQKRQSYRRCYDQSCQIAIGRELAAQKSLATQLLKLGSQCVLVSTLYDLRTEASERSASARTACMQDELLGAIDKVVARLQPGAAARPPAPVPTPPATTAASPAPPVADRAEADRARSSMATWKWITGAAALAGISAGIVLATQASSRARELESMIAAGNPSLSQPTEAYSAEMRQKEDDYHRLEKGSIAMFVVGGVVAVASTVLFVSDRKPARRTTILPVVGSSTVGISGQVRF